MKSIKQADVKGKRVLVRVGFDVPIENGKVIDDTRIKAALPTIEYLQKSGAANIFLLSHLGRPDGKEVDDLRLEPIAERLAELLKIKDYKKEDLKGAGFSDFKWDIYHLDPNILLLENIRFDSGEEENSEGLAKRLASIADSPRGLSRRSKADEAGIYVNDALSVSHREHCSVSAITKYLPSYAGLSLEKEISELDKITKNPARPLGIIIGGAKTEDKLPAVKNLSTLADFFLLGGVVANTFLAARGHDIGKSKVDDDLIDDAKKIWTQIMDDPNRDIFLPRDFVISKLRKKPKDVEIISIKDIEKLKDSHYKIVDIGPKTIKLYSKKIAEAGTIFWNGNLGVTEVKDFSRGSEGIAKTIAENDTYSVIGGGDTGGFVNRLGLGQKFDFISTGGGATLEYLAGKELPGIKTLE